MPPQARKDKPRPAPNDLAPKRSSPQPHAQIEVVDPAWIGGAFVVCLVAALVCAWLTVCLLVYQGEWQLVLHPSKIIDRTPAAAGLAFDPVRFDSTETGQPRLTGWWIAAAPGARYAGDTVLYLHDGSLSLSATVPELARLHQAGLNVFAIDYRGFGLSDASDHPTEARMAQDTAAALDYLTSVRHLSAKTVVPYGVGLGCSLAVTLARQHSEIPAVILENPDPDPTATAVAARPSNVIPVRLLFREHFDLATPLEGLKTPKLLIAGGPDSAIMPVQLAAIQRLFRRAADPSFDVTLPAVRSEDAYRTALTRFLDEYLAGSR